MFQIYLKIQDYGDAVERVPIFALEIIPKITSDAVTANTLRGVMVEHSGHHRRGWDISIPASEIRDDGKLDYLTNWYLSSDRKLSFNGVDFFSVFIKPGDMPLDFLEKIMFLPIIRFSVQSTLPGAERKPGESIFRIN